MYTTKNRAFLLTNHVKSVLGSTRYKTKRIGSRQWEWLEAGSPQAEETVVLLHGLAMTKSHWRVVIPELTERFRVIVPDVPGLKIGTIAAQPDQGLEGLASELAPFLDAIVGRPVHLVGHSMAAALATGLALRLPIPVKSIVLVSVAEAIFTDDLAKVLRAEKVSEYMSNYTEESHVAYVRSMFCYPPAGLDLIAKNSWRTIRDHIPAIVDMCRAMETEMHYLEENAFSLSIPILVVNGQQDYWRDLTRETRLFTRSGVERVILDECRHLPFLEQPVKFARALRQFLLAE